LVASGMMVLASVDFGFLWTQVPVWKKTARLVLEASHQRASRARSYSEGPWQASGAYEQWRLIFEETR